MRDRSLGASSANYWPGPLLVQEATAGPLEDTAVKGLRQVTSDFGGETIQTAYVRDGSIDSPRVLSVIRVGVEMRPGRRLIEVVVLEWPAVPDAGLKTRRITVNSRPGSCVEYDDRKLLDAIDPSAVADLMARLIDTLRPILSTV